MAARQCVRGRVARRAGNGCRRARGEPAVAEPHRSRVAALRNRPLPIDCHARQSLRARRAGRDAGGGAGRARARAERARHARRRHGAAGVRHQRRGARAPWSRRRRSRDGRAPGGAATHMIVLFWDIDGTLLTTGKAGVPAWEAAVHEVTGREFQLSSIRIPGLTDFQIAVRTFELLGVEPEDATLRRMIARYEEFLPAALPKKEGRVLPNVREILERLRGRSDLRSYLLTGNTRNGAKAKLTHYGLFDYFPDGAFAEDAGER